MRKLGVPFAIAVLGGIVASAAAASTPGADGAILFTQPRCPSWVGFRCDALPQPCAVDAVTAASFVPQLPLGAVPSPDGRRIAWLAIRSRVFRLLVANADGSGERALADADPTGSPPAWSPDGTQIAFEGASATNPSPLEVVDVATGAVRRLVSGVFDQSWAADGSEIVVEAFDSNVRPVIGAVDPGDGSLRYVTSEPNTPDQPSDTAPDWSPDSSTIAFTRSAFGLPPQLQAVARDGSGRRDVTEGASPSWSPDGSRIAFVRDGGVWTTAPDGSVQQRVAWVPDVAPTQPRWLSVAQTSPLRSVGNCDTDVSENDADYEGGDGIDTFVVTSVRVGVFGNGGDDFFFVGHAAEAGPTVLDGGPGNDDFELFGSTNTVHAGIGNDRIDAVLDGAPQQLFGGPGSDWIRGGYGNDAIDGGSGNDALYGVYGSNTIHGGSGNDTIAAYSGSAPQRLYGDAGDDRLVGGSGSDRLDGGPGRDTILGHRGNDVIRARDGFRDAIDCGAGRDTVYADRFDAIARNCEQVIRR